MTIGLRTVLFAQTLGQASLALVLVLVFEAFHRVWQQPFQPKFAALFQ